MEPARAATFRRGCRPTGVRRGWVVLLLTTTVLSACTSTPESPAAPTPTPTTGASPSAAPATTVEAVPVCAAGQLSAVSVIADGTRGELVRGTWTVPFAVVNLGPDCTLASRGIFVRVRGRLVRTAHRHGEVRIPVGAYIELRLRLIPGSGSCASSTGEDAALIFGRRVPSRARAVDLQLVQVPGVVVPTEALACVRARLGTASAPLPAPPELLSRARQARPETKIRLPAGLPPSRMAAPLFLHARGVPLPSLCGDVRGRFDAGVASSRLLFSIDPRRSSQELRELDAWPSVRQAESAYRLLFDSVRVCPQHGETGTTSELHEEYLGPGSFEVVASDVATGAGESWSRWVVARRGRYVLIALVSSFDRRSPSAVVASVVSEMGQLG